MKYGINDGIVAKIALPKIISVNAEDITKSNTNGRQIFKFFCHVSNPLLIILPISSTTLGGYVFFSINTLAV